MCVNELLTETNHLNVRRNLALMAITFCVGEEVRRVKHVWLTMDFLNLLQNCGDNRNSQIVPEKSA